MLIPRRHCCDTIIICYRLTAMKAAIILACLLVAVAAKPQFPGFGNSANGFSNAQATLGQTSGLLGNSQLLQSSATAGVSSTMCIFHY